MSDRSREPTAFALSESWPERPGRAAAESGSLR